MQTIAGVLEHTLISLPSLLHLFQIRIVPSWLYSSDISVVLTISYSWNVTLCAFCVYLRENG